VQTTHMKNRNFDSTFHNIKIFVGNGNESQAFVIISVKVLNNINCFFATLYNTKVMR